MSRIKAGNLSRFRQFPAGIQLASRRERLPARGAFLDLAGQLAVFSRTASGGSPQETSSTNDLSCLS
jgi:hypothetical protein